MTREQAESVMNSTKQHFSELGWPDTEVNAALAYVSMSLLTLTYSGLPLNNIKFPEILRAVANILEIQFQSNEGWIHD